MKRLIIFGFFLFCNLKFQTTFVSRCKLYRYDRDTKENKERGLGDIKVIFFFAELFGITFFQILRNKITGGYRCLMRREQVLKLCANFQIVEGMKITQKPNLPTAYSWACKANFLFMCF